MLTAIIIVAVQPSIKFPRNSKQFVTEQSSLFVILFRTPFSRCLDIWSGMDKDRYQPREIRFSIFPNFHTLFARVYKRRTKLPIKSSISSIVGRARIDRLVVGKCCRLIIVWKFAGKLKRIKVDGRTKGDKTLNDPLTGSECS